MTEAFGESTDRHRALMQNNTAIDFLTDQYGFSRLTGSDRDNADCKYSAGAKVQTGFFRTLLSDFLVKQISSPET